MYNSLANFYDSFTEDVDYKIYSQYLDSIIKKYKEDSVMILDLACGTGNLTLEFNKLGYDVTGLDISQEMLNECYSKNSEILWINQDMTDFDLYGTYDVIVSFLDSINHITDINELEKTFKLVKNYLDPKGLFIFDLNSEYKIECIYGNNVFYQVDDDLTYLWENHYDSDSKICEMDVTIFEKNNDMYKRFDDSHAERAYSQKEIETLAKKYGLEVKGVFKDLTLDEIDDKTERIFFVLQKI